MIIKKRNIISWLLDDNDHTSCYNIPLPGLRNQVLFDFLTIALENLINIHDRENPKWGLPEIIMPSFEEVMKKSAKSFYNIDHQLFEEFYKDNECGIIITEDTYTIVYGFSENTLHTWVFTENKGYSEFFLYFYVVSTEENKRIIYACQNLAEELGLAQEGSNDDNEIYESITNKIITYLAVKKYVKVETIKIPDGKRLNIDKKIEDYHGKCKVINYSGQQVVVMDSRWFRKIVNDNNIFVRGFFRLQNKKDEYGNWYKELIFVDSFVRHGYHRNASLEDDEKNEEETNE